MSGVPRVANYCLIWAVISIQQADVFLWQIVTVTVLCGQVGGYWQAASIFSVADRNMSAVAESSQLHGRAERETKCRGDPLAKPKFLSHLQKYGWFPIAP
jgi:hypothetical protein